MRRFANVALLAAAVAALASCGARETAVERGDREGVLHLSIGAENPRLDPHLATSVTDYQVIAALAEGLVDSDPVTLAPVPGVAKRWSVSDDGLTYTFKLRENARWSNGEPVVASDFIRSWRRALSPALSADNAYLMHVVEGAKAFNEGIATDFSKVGFSAPDEHTLEITLAHPVAYFLKMLAHPVWLPVHMDSVERAGAADDRSNPWTRSAPYVGNGPFTLREVRPNQRVVVDKNPAYWDTASVHLNEIDFEVFDSLDAEERAFRAGQLHITQAVPLSSLRKYRQRDAGELRMDPYLATYFYRLNIAKPPLDDVRVRRALSLAVDREAIVEHILGGGQKPALSLTPPGAGSYQPPMIARTDFNEARRLLAEAGHPGGAGLPKIEILFNTSEGHRTIAEAIQEMWHRELGLDVSLVNQDFKVTLAARSTGDYQVLRSSWIGDFVDVSSFLGVFTSTSGNNHTRWSDPEFDRLVEEGMRLPDSPERDMRFQHAETILLEAMPIIPVYYYTHVFLIQPSVHGWHSNLLDLHPYKNVWLEPPK